MKKTIQLILELDNKEDVPLGWIKKDLTSQINSAGFYYEVKECMEIEPDKNKNDKLISMVATIDALDRFNVCGYVEEPWEKLRDALQVLPSSQSKIIKCSECRNWGVGFYDDIETCFIHRNIDGTEQATKPDDFCSYGVRREE